MLLHPGVGEQSREWFIMKHVIVYSGEIYSQKTMSNNNDEKKCAFGVFLDIVDGLQAINKKGSSREKASNADNKRCPYCLPVIGPGAKACCSCGKAQPE